MTDQNFEFGNTTAITSLHPYEFCQALGDELGGVSGDEHSLALQLLSRSDLSDALHRRADAIRECVGGSTLLVQSFKHRVFALHALVTSEVGETWVFESLTAFEADSMNSPVPNTSVPIVALFSAAATLGFLPDGQFDTDEVINAATTTSLLSRSLFTDDVSRRLLFAALRPYRSQFRDLMGAEDYRRQYGERDYGPVGIHLAVQFLDLFDRQYIEVAPPLFRVVDVNPESAPNTH